MEESSVNTCMGEKQRRFEYLVNGYSTDIYRIAYWLCRDKMIAEDLSQETFLRAWRALDSLEDETKSRAWLVTILRRENARRFDRKQLELVDIEEHEPAMYEDRWPDAELERDELRQAIGCLPIAYREPLVLQQLGGFSCEEIAQMLGLGKGAVMTRLFRAKQKLALVLTGDDSVGRVLKHG
jgi:RNA polymerase sigma-70 factor (ECF subfamily)